jgi:hypothetical protein
MVTLRYLPFICERFPYTGPGRIEESFPSISGARLRVQDLAGSIEDAEVRCECCGSYVRLDPVTGDTL